MFTAQCIGPLGMETGAIPDADITASSSFDSGNVGPHHGRSVFAHVLYIPQNLHSHCILKIIFSSILKIDKIL